MNRKVCVVTSSRADYGLLRWVMQEIKDDPLLTLNLIATGMHLSPEFGGTYKEIESDGFSIDSRVEMLMSSDSPVGLVKSMGVGSIGFADAFNRIEPDLIIVLGDRYEIFSAVSAALILQIPVAHLHGGEVTEGAFDDALRHSITKMSHIHFVAAEEYRNRVIQLGESPDLVYVVGGLGVDSITKVNLLNKQELEESLGFKFRAKNLLVTFHPATLDETSAKHQMEQLLQALELLQDTHLIFTLPNADTSSRELIEMVKSFSQKKPDCRSIFPSLGSVKYLSCIAQVDGVVGNSSSGLLEVPTFKKGTVNIGNRQRGRLMAKSIINCEPDVESISLGIERLYSHEFQFQLQSNRNPYGIGGASKKIVQILKSINLEGITKKSFFDLRDEIDKSKLN